jgi:hypothetical protein
MNALAGVFFQVNACQADPFLVPFDRGFDPPALGERLIKLRYLIAFGQVRIEVVFPRKSRRTIDATVRRQRCLDR